jgi:hypothetical protein
MSGLDAKVERLEAEATERWGDKWVIETLRFADGDSRAHAPSGASPSNAVRSDWLLIVARPLRA